MHTKASQDRSGKARGPRGTSEMRHTTQYGVLCVFRVSKASR